MATRKPLVIIDGQMQQLPTGDVIVTDTVMVHSFESLVALSPDFGAVNIDAPFSNEQKAVHMLDCVDYNEIVDLGGL